MTKNYFGKGVAETYDADEPVAFDPGVVEPAVDFLAVLAAGGRTLELGIGTGRIALPLSERGVPIHGIELSPEMVEQLQAKQGSESIEVTIGDFSTTEVEGTFTLAYLVFNTITNLTSQRAQIRCFQNVANHLESGGCFVIETFIPELRVLPPGVTVRSLHLSANQLDFDEYDVASQGLISHHYRRVDGALTGTSIPFRYVWPSELDLMAELAGMKLIERWEWWNRRPFTNDSGSHVSVWKKL
jgi:SAM-dependent methyltransferase